MIYEPKEDSFLLQKFVKKYAKGKVLDVGTGSGIQARTAKENTSNVLAVDINPEAVEAAKNAGIKARVSDLFSKVRGKFDLIIFNPPYLPEEELEDEESKRITTGGKKGNEVLERFLKEAKDHLEKDGIILLVISSLTPKAEYLFNKYKYKFELLEKEHVFFEDIIVYKLL